MSEIILAQIREKSNDRPVLRSIWDTAYDLLEAVSPPAIAFYFTEAGQYGNLAVLTPIMVLDLEANETNKRTYLFTAKMANVNGVLLTTVPDELSDPLSPVAEGTRKNATLKAGLLDPSGEPYASWFASGHSEEDQLRTFAKAILVTLHG